MEYRFFDSGDEALIRNSELPTEDVVAIAVRTTGYNADKDEVLELAIVDLDGTVLFNQRVKPQNVEDWDASSDAAGGIAPADVEDAPELYQFEDEIVEHIQGARSVVAAHVPFVKSMLEQSWVSIPDFGGFDVVEEFRLLHCAADYPSQPATVATLEGAIEYYGFDCDAATCLGSARGAADCYKALIDESKRERQSKPEGHWDAHDRRVAEEKAAEERRQAALRARDRKAAIINAFMWSMSAIIFTGVGIQLYQRGADGGALAICGAMVVFAISRAIINLVKR